jgi:hypothetical protein
MSRLQVTLSGGAAAYWRRPSTTNSSRNLLVRLGP